MQVLLCADLWKRQETLYAAYHDREGVTEAFIKNGIRHALGSLGNAAAADPANWDYEVGTRLSDTENKLLDASCTLGLRGSHQERHALGSLGNAAAADPPSGTTR